MIFLALLNIGLAGLLIVTLFSRQAALDRVTNLEFKLYCLNNGLSSAKEILDTVVGKPSMARRYDATQPQTNYLN
jgi:hypothetical protein